MKRKLRGIVGGATLVLLALYLFVRFVIGDVYHVGTSSMEPTIWGAEGGGEWVFVRFDRSAPRRHDLVVARVPGESMPVVKRVLGLPGESIRISDGDVLVDHVRLRPSEPRPEPVPIFDDRWHRLDERFRLDSALATRWRKDGDAWFLDARDVTAGADGGLLFADRPLVDDYLGPDHELVKGTTPVHDARFECQLRFDDPTGRARFVLREGDDAFELALERVDATSVTLTLTRARPNGATLPLPSDGGGDEVRGASVVRETLAARTFELAVGAWTTISFENRDDTLRVEGDALGVVTHTYKENSPRVAGSAADATSDPIAFGGEGGRFAFRALRVARDLDYTSEGRFGVATDVLLGPDELFLLGDHSSRSRDSREWGPVHARTLRGRPVAVVWPPSRWRALSR